MDEELRESVAYSPVSGRSKVYSLDEAHMPHNFALPEVHGWTAEEILAAVEGYESVLPSGAWPNWGLSRGAEFCSARWPHSPCSPR